MSTVLLRGQIGRGVTTTTNHVAAAWRRCGGTVVGCSMMRRYDARGAALGLDVLDHSSARFHSYVLHDHSGTSGRDGVARSVTAQGLEAALQSAQARRTRTTLLVLDIFNRESGLVLTTCASSLAAVERLVELAQAWPGPMLVALPSTLRHHHVRLKGELLRAPRMADATTIWTSPGAIPPIVQLCMGVLAPSNSVPRNVGPWRNDPRLSLSAAKAAAPGAQASV